MPKMKKQTKEYIISTLFLMGILYGLYELFVETDYPWQWYRVWEFIAVYDEGQWWAGELMYGVEQTVYIVLMSIVLSFFIGAMIAWGRFTKGKIAHGFCLAYVTFIRNTPVLIQVYLLYFILAPMINLDRYVTGILVISIYEAAFVAEIIRGAIQSIERGQWEAGYSVGLSTRIVVRKIVFPQALRLLVGPMTNVTINLLKHSSIVSVIAVSDLTTTGRNLISETYLAMEIWLVVAVLYWIMSGVFATVGRTIEKRIKWKS